MSVWRQIARGLRGLVRRDAADRDAADEVQHYLEEAAAAHRSRGLPPAEAQRAAQLEIGNATVVREQLRGVGWENVVVTLVADLRFAWRLAARRPGFSVLVALTLAIGAGATTAIYSAVRPILFEPLPYPAPDRLVTVTERGRDGLPAGIGFATIKDIEASSRSFEALAAVGLWVPTLNGRAEPERVEGAKVSSTYFAVLGVRPFLGRDFRKEEDRPNAPRVAILSYGLWRGRFGGDSTVVGGPITVDGLPFTVAGVMPPGFENVIDPAVQIWEPLRYDVSLPYACRTCHHLQAIGRLKAGIRVAAATSELNLISARLVADHPTEYEAPGMLVPALKDQVIGGVRSALLVLFGAAGLVLLIACANVASLVLGRALAHQRQVAMRTALGAGRRRLVQGALVEGAVLAAGGGGLGLLATAWCTPLLVRLAGPDLPRASDISLDGRVLVTCLGASALAAILTAVLPAWHAARLPPGEVLKSGGPERTVTGRGRLGGALLVGQLALTTVLLAGAALLARSFAGLTRVDPGFDPRHLLAADVDLPGVQYQRAAQRVEYVRRAEEALGAVPGVVTTAAGTGIPLAPGALSVTDHRGPDGTSRPVLMFIAAVTPDYFRALGIPLLRGRALEADDPNAVVIDAAVADEYFPGEDPIGKPITIYGNVTRTVVGVVGNVRQEMLPIPAPMHAYEPYGSEPVSHIHFLVVTRGAPALAAGAVRRALQAVDPDVPVDRVRPMTALMSASLAKQRLYAVLLGSFAVIALALSAVGVYGLASYGVSDRTREFGIRIALGADPHSLLRLVLGRAIVLGGLGLVIGLAAALAATKILRGLLYGVGPGDPASLAGAAALLLGATVAASFLPARRATRVDPMVALRAE